MRTRFAVLGFAAAAAVLMATSPPPGNERHQTKNDDIGVKIEKMALEPATVGITVASAARMVRQDLKMTVLTEHVQAAIAAARAGPSTILGTDEILPDGFGGRIRRVDLMNQASMPMTPARLSGTASRSTPMRV